MRPSALARSAAKSEATRKLKELLPVWAQRSLGAAGRSARRRSGSRHLRPTGNSRRLSRAVLCQKPPQPADRPTDQRRLPCRHERGKGSLRIA